MKPAAPQRIFAVDVHPLSFGFAIFATPDELLDWGIKSFRHGVNAVKVPMREKMVLLLDRYEPNVIVMKMPTSATLKRRSRTIAELARQRKINVRLIPGRAMRDAFPGSNQNKYDRATVIAQRYPELSPRLGVRRKVWKAEKYSMSIFDATALGIAYFMREDNTEKRHRTPSALPN